MMRAAHSVHSARVYLAPMLLNEVQQQSPEISDLGRQIAELKEMFATLRLPPGTQRVATR
jgi:hypothetical protein